MKTENKTTIKTVDGFTLVKTGENFYQMSSPEGVFNTSGSKEEMIEELNRWKIECDHNNEFMINIEDQFIKALTDKK